LWRYLSALLRISSMAIGHAAPTVSAASTANGNTADGVFTNLLTAATTGQTAVFVSAFNLLRTAYYPTFHFVLNVVSTTDLRIWVGICSAQPNNSDRGLSLPCVQWTTSAGYSRN